MSMLAEPRRRQRIGPNPRGKFFTEDEDNKGRTLLQKMGWKSGDGLGVGRQGMRDPIKPKINSDSKGLGFEVKSDPWVSHTDDFNEILKNLQATHGGGGMDIQKGQEDEEVKVHKTKKSKSRREHDGLKDEKKTLGLESKSKTSRSRIHYHKIVKNKDLSKIKDNDWSCIFGKKVDVQSVPLPPESAVAETVAESSSHSRRRKASPSSSHSRPVSPPPLSREFAQAPAALVDTCLQNRNPSQYNFFKSQMTRSFVKSTLAEDQPVHDIDDENNIDEKPQEEEMVIDDVKFISESLPGTESNTALPPSDEGSTSTSRFKRHLITADEMYAAANVFKGSNILHIPGYRNQSNKLL